MLVMIAIIIIIIKLLALNNLLIKHAILLNKHNTNIAFIIYKF